VRWLLAALTVQSFSEKSQESNGSMIAYCWAVMSENLQRSVFYNLLLDTQSENLQMSVARSLHAATQYPANFFFFQKSMHAMLIMLSIHWMHATAQDDAPLLVLHYVVGASMRQRARVQQLRAAVLHSLPQIRKANQCCTAWLSGLLFI